MREGMKWMAVSLNVVETKKTRGVSFKMNKLNISKGLERASLTRLIYTCNKQKKSEMFKIVTAS